MPHVINGIGTWYYGRANVHTQQGRCDSCGNVTSLTSYDTTEFFTVVFVPLIPLRKYHILDQCAVCRKHRRMPLAAYHEAKKAKLADVVGTWREDSRNADKAERVLGFILAFQDADTLAGVAPDMERTFRDHLPVISALGEASETLGRLEEAKRCYSRAVTLADGAVVALAGSEGGPDSAATRASAEAEQQACRKRLARVLLKLGDPVEADRQISFIIHEKLADQAPMLMLLIEGYQAAGMHREAISVIDDILAAFPRFKADRAIQKARKTSEKNLATGRPIKSTRLASGFGAVRKPLPRWPKLVLPALLGLGLAIWIIACFSIGSSRVVQVVNGLDRAYEVKVGGERLHLPARSHAQVTLAEGDYAVVVNDPQLRIPPQTARIHSTFWSRPAKGHTFVINPDRTAEVIYERIEYTDRNHDEDAARYEPHAGQLVYDLPAVDYLFADFPQSIRAEKNTRVLKSRLVLNTDDKPLQIAARLIKQGGNKAAADYLLSHLEMDPDDALGMQVLQALMEPQQARELVKAKLAVRPVQMQWHRFYQELTERNDPGYDLAGEYRRLLAADANNPTLMYLLGRVTDDRAEAKRLFTAAAEGRPPVAFASYALAYDAMSQARYAEALTHLRAARALQPKEDLFQRMEEEAMEALGQYNELAERARADAAKKDSPHLLILETYCRACAGDVTRASGLVDMYLSRHSSELSPEEAAETREFIRGIVAYTLGNSQPQEQFWGKRKDPHDTFMVAISQGRADVAESNLGDKRSSTEVLLLYIVAKRASRDDIAARALKRVAEVMPKDGKEMRQLAGWLAAPQGPDTSVACEINLPPSTKRIAMAALALRFPSDRATYAQYGAKLNFDRQYPHLVLKDVFAQPAP